MTVVQRILSSRPSFTKRQQTEPEKEGHAGDDEPSPGSPIPKHENTSFMAKARASKFSKRFARRGSDLDDVDEDISDLNELRPENHLIHQPNQTGPAGNGDMVGMHSGKSEENIENPSTEGNSLTESQQVATSTNNESGRDLYQLKIEQKLKVDGDNSKFARTAQSSMAPMSKKCPKKSVADTLEERIRAKIEQEKKPASVRFEEKIRQKIKSDCSNENESNLHPARFNPRKCERRPRPPGLSSSLPPETSVRFDEQSYENARRKLDEKIALKRKTEAGIGCLSKSVKMSLTLDDIIAIKSDPVEEDDCHENVQKLSLDERIERKLSSRSLKLNDSSSSVPLASSSRHCRKKSGSHSRKVSDVTAGTCDLTINNEDEHGKELNRGGLEKGGHTAASDEEMVKDVRDVSETVADIETSLAVEESGGDSTSTIGADQSEAQNTELKLDISEGSLGSLPEFPRKRVARSLARQHRNDTMVASSNTQHDWGGNATVDDIPTMLQRLKSHPTPERIKKIFQSLFLLSTEPGFKGELARKEILANGGMEALVSALWNHMESGECIQILLRAFWAISVFDRSAEEAFASVSKIQNSGVLDALLVSLQSHVDDLSIQEIGCDLIHQLAIILPDDQTEMQSSIIVICRNMWIIGPNTKAYLLGLNALDTLCSVSDDNKREFARGGPECFGAPGRVLASSSTSMETRELACQLFRCVTSDETASSMLSSKSSLTKHLLDALQNIPRPKFAAQMYESIVGTFSNMSLDPATHSEMVENGALSTLCWGVSVFQDFGEILSLSSSIFARLSTTAIGSAAIADDGLDAIFSIMEYTPGDANTQLECLKALDIVCDSSSGAITKISKQIQLMTTSYFCHQKNDLINESIASIFSKLSREKFGRKSFSDDQVDVLAEIMKFNPEKECILINSCKTLRYLTEEESIIPTLLSRGFVSLVTDSMNADTGKEELQEHACKFFMNLALYSAGAASQICSEGCIQCIVNITNANQRSPLVQQAAFGALWAIIHNSEMHREVAVSGGVIDAAIHALSLHHNETAVLEYAMKVLASISSMQNAIGDIASAGGMSSAVETMVSNYSSPELVLAGANFVQNMSAADPRHADEAVAAIQIFLKCMEDHTGSENLVEKMCEVLQCLILQSELCKAMIIENGVGVIDKIRIENENAAPITSCTNSLLDVIAAMRTTER